MFAVLKTGGKQYKVASGDTLRVEKLAAAAGEAIQFNDVLMVGDQVGTPLVAGAAVQATVIDQVKGDKVIHFVRRRRKHSSKRTKGHRQQLTLVRVTEILASGAESTGVKAAIGAGFREPAPAGVLDAARQAGSRAVSAVAEGASAVAEGAQTATQAVGDGAQAALERVQSVAPAGIGAAARRAASSIREEAQSVAGRVEDAAERAVEAVTDAVEDVAESKAGKVALAAAAAAGVAAIAAAVLLPSTPAEADEAEGDAAPDAPEPGDETKE